MTVRIGITIGDATSAAVCRTDGEVDPTIFTSSTVLAIDVDGTVLFADDVDVPAMREPSFATDFVDAIPRSDGFALADGQSVRPEDLMARAVWCMVESVHAMSDDDNRVLVVTHPARWSRNSRNRLRDGLDHVGLPEARLVSEADAAVNHLRSDHSRQLTTAVVTADLDVVDIAVIGARAEASLGPSPTIGTAASTRPARGVTLRSAYFRGPEVVADLWRDAVDRAGTTPRRLILTGVRGDDPALSEICARISGLIPELQPHLAARGAYVIADRLVAASCDPHSAEPKPAPAEPEPEEYRAAPAASAPTKRARRLLDRTPVVSGVTMLGLAAIAVGAMSTSPGWSGQDRTGRESDFPTVSSSVIYMPTQDAVESEPPTTTGAPQPGTTADSPAAVPPATGNLYVPPVVTSTAGGSPPVVAPTTARTSRNESTGQPAGGSSAESTSSPTGWEFPSLPVLPTVIVPTSTESTTQPTRTTTPAFSATSQISTAPTSATRSESASSSAGSDNSKESEIPRRTQDSGR